MISVRINVRLAPEADIRLRVETSVVIISSWLQFNCTATLSTLPVKAKGTW